MHGSPVGTRSGPAPPLTERNMKKKRNTIETFFQQTEPIGESGCLVWHGKLTKKGYGVFCYSGKTYAAHRLAWEIEHGPIPNELVMDHLCRVRCCVNVHHLELVTNKENLRRGYSFSALNARKTHCQRGHLLSEENNVFRKNRPSERTCKACHRLTSLEWNRRHGR